MCVKVSWTMIKLILAFLWEREREMLLLGHSSSRSVIPLLSLLLFSIRSTKIQPGPKRHGNPRTFPLSHSHLPTKHEHFQSSYFGPQPKLWWKQNIFTYSAWFIMFSHGMTSVSHSNIRGMLIWQCAVTAQQTPYMLPLQIFRNHM